MKNKKNLGPKRLSLSGPMSLVGVLPAVLPPKWVVATSGGSFLRCGRVVVVAVVVVVDGGKSGSERACEYVRICLILHVKLKFRVWPVYIRDVTCYLRAGWNDLLPSTATNATPMPIPSTPNCKPTSTHVEEPEAPQHKAN
jgi:hypothetical protein